MFVKELEGIVTAALGAVKPSLGFSGLVKDRLEALKRLLTQTKDLEQEVMSALEDVCKAVQSTTGDTEQEQLRQQATALRDVTNSLLREMVAGKVVECGPWRRARAVIVGEARGGKSSLLRRLMGHHPNEINRAEPSTRGVAVKSVNAGMVQISEFFGLYSTLRPSWNEATVAKETISMVSWDALQDTKHADQERIVRASVSTFLFKPPH